MTRTRPTQSGNVLFIILIAVVLFGALSFAISQTMRTNATNPDKEIADIDAASMIQFGSSIESAISRIKLSGGCSNEQISFENPLVSGYNNATSPATNRCHIFLPEGGNMQLFIPVRTQMDQSFATHPLYGFPFFNASLGFLNVGTAPSGAGTAPGVELAMFIPFVKREVCMDLNQRLGITGANVEPPWVNTQHRIDSTKYTGTFSYTDPADDPTFFEHNAMCFKIDSFTGGGGAAAGAYVYAHVLVPR